MTKRVPFSLTYESYRIFRITSSLSSKMLSTCLFITCVLYGITFFSMSFLMFLLSYLVLEFFHLWFQLQSKIIIDRILQIHEDVYVIFVGLQFASHLFFHILDMSFQILDWFLFTQKGIVVWELSIKQRVSLATVSTMDVTCRVRVGASL
jgi:hypothetical protein